MGTEKRRGCTNQWWSCSVSLLIGFFACHDACAGILTGKTTCGSVGQRSRVTCHFSRDVNKVHGVTGIVLQRQSLSDNGSLPDFVAECHRVNGDPFMCMNKPGYRVHGVSDSWAVDILKEGSDHEGRFSCILLPEKLVTYNESQHCVLKFTGGITGSTVCDVTQQGEHSTVSCHFSDDINKVKNVTGIVLMRHSLPDHDGLPDIVAECHRTNGDPFMCFWKSGYRVRGDISNVTVVEILEQDSEHEGRYSCVLLPERLVTYTESKHCILNFNANKETPILTDKGRNNGNADKTSTTIKPGETASETASGRNNYDSYTTIVLGSCVGLLSVFVVILTTLLLRRRRLQHCQSSTSDNVQEKFLKITYPPVEIPHLISTTPEKRPCEISVPVIIQLRLKHSPTQERPNSCFSTDTGIEAETEENGEQSCLEIATEEHEL